MEDIKYNLKDFKGDLIAGGINGGVFGLIYSFFFLPVDKIDPKIFSKCRNSPMLYFAINTIKMGAAFAIMRSTYNGVKKQELGQKYEIGSSLGALALICTFI